MDIPLKHIIGSVALLGLVIAAGLSYTMVTFYIAAEANKQQLTKVAENVAINLVEIISLINFANDSGNIQMKTLKLPSAIGGNAYTIQLVNETNQGYYVLAQLATKTDVTAKSLIPINSTQTCIELVTDQEKAPTIFDITDIVYGGAAEIVVWGWKFYYNTTYVGIGAILES